MKKMIMIALLAVGLMAWQNVNQQNKAELENALATKIESDAVALHTPEGLKIAQQIGIRPLIIIFDPENLEEYFSGRCKNSPGSALLDLRKALLDATSPVITTLELWDDLCACKYDLKQWHIYTSDDQSKIIFIPRSGIYEEYLGKLNDFSAGGKDKNISDGQLLLGIKLNLDPAREITVSTEVKGKTTTKSWDDLETDEEMQQFAKERTEIKLAEETRADLGKYLKEILITREDLKGWGDIYLNQWDIFLAGHGDHDNIAGMAKKFFTSLLDFLNKEINTRSLLYETCYAGGENLKEPYQYKMSVPEGIIEERAKNLNFTVMSATTFDLPTVMTGSPMGLSIYIFSNADFNAYFHELNEFFNGIDQKTIKLLKENKNSQEVLKDIKEAINKRGSLASIIQKVSHFQRSLDPNNATLIFPTVRFPNSERFAIQMPQVPLPNDKGAGIDYAVVRLDNSVIMRAINMNVNQIAIPKETTMVLLEAQYIPIPVIIEGDKMPFLIPVDMSRNYFFQEIRAPEIDLFKGHYSITSSLQAMLSNRQNKIIDALQTMIFDQRNDDVVSMLLNLRKKTLYLKDDLGNLCIEKLIMKVGSQTEREGTNLGWGSAPLELSNVVLHIDVSVIDLAYNNQSCALRINPVDKQKSVWACSDSKYVSNGFSSMKAKTREQSTLPESMKGEAPKPIVELSLWHEYAKRKDKPEELAKWRAMLNQEQQKRLDDLTDIRKMNPELIDMPELIDPVE